MWKTACLPDTVPSPRAVLPRTLKFTGFRDEPWFVSDHPRPRRSPAKHQVIEQKGRVFS